MNGKGIQKKEQLNGRGPKNEALNQRGIKIKSLMERDLKISSATHHCWTRYVWEGIIKML